MELGSLVPKEHKDEALLYLLFNPSKNKIEETVRVAVRTGRSNPNSIPFKGFRALKLYNREKKKNVCILWPSFSWTHDTVSSIARKYFSGFEQVDQQRFNFDRDNVRFSQEKITFIDEWMKKVQENPIPPRNIREDE